MILYSIMKLFDSLAFFLINLVPAFVTPTWITTQLPDILTRIASFNYYLPIAETVGVVVFLITFTLSYKLIKVVLNFVHIDLNS